MTAELWQHALQFLDRHGGRDGTAPLEVGEGGWTLD